MTEKPFILVVDDDGPILALMRNLLKEFGFQPLTADSGMKAIDAARQHRPSLVLLDKNMPGMSGAEVARALRAEPSLERVPIVILSGEPMSNAELAAMQADGAVMKPFELPALIEEIRKRLNGVSR